MMILRRNMLLGEKKNEDALEGTGRPILNRKQLIKLYRSSKERGVVQTGRDAHQIDKQNTRISPSQS